jgi:hypothetical protein
MKPTNKKPAASSHEAAGPQLASFSCPVCGERPILFRGNRKWNNGLPVVECLCLAPFSPKPEFAEEDIWVFPMVRNADAWGLFVQWKLSLPVPI